MALIRVTNILLTQWDVQAAAASQAESTAPASFPAAPLSELEISEQILKVACSPTNPSDACASVHHTQSPLSARAPLNAVSVVAPARLSLKQLGRHALRTGTCKSFQNRSAFHPKVLTTASKSLKSHSISTAIAFLILSLPLQNRKLEYRQHLLEKEIADMQEAFDNALALLRREKLSLEADVKAAHIKRLAYQQELQLLKVCPCITVSNKSQRGEDEGCQVLKHPNEAQHRSKSC